MKNWFACHACEKWGDEPCVVYYTALIPRQCLETSDDPDESDWRPATDADMEIVRRSIVEYEHKTGPVDPNCEYCAGTGWTGDNGPGIRGNREYMPCDMCGKPPTGKEG